MTGMEYLEKVRMAARVVTAMERIAGRNQLNSTFAWLDEEAERDPIGILTHTESIDMIEYVELPAGASQTINGARALILMAAKNCSHHDVYDYMESGKEG